ncbi:hypothetical protein VTI74DRAFT_10066 [Chaetomium olivicolor]
MPSMLSSGSARTAASAPSGGAHSAPVLEFICLFTHDLRRKQKRWEDGRLKYHTFNKRVMVYDERGNFVGDMHWQRDWDFDEGEEVQLERGGVIVQVVECVGRQEQDLTELLDKRAKEKEERQARIAMRPSPATSLAQTPLPGSRAQDHFQTRHRSLHHVLGTPTGHHGRAVVPTESPFELRQKAAEAAGDQSDPRPPKRRKWDITAPTKMGYAQQLFGATLTLSAAPVSSAPLRRPTAPAARRQTEPPSSPEEDMLPADSACGNAASSTADTSLGSSSRAGFSGAQSKTGLETERENARGERASPAPEPGALARPHPVKAIPSLLKNVSRLADVKKHQPGTVPNRGNTMRAVPPRTASEHSEPQMNAPKRHEVIDKAGTEAWEDETGRVPGPRLGASRSLAIVLDEDSGAQSDGTGQVVELQGDAARIKNWKRAATGTNQKPAKRSKPPVPETKCSEPQNEEVEEPCREERTELRLKPRQKRGLLLLTEKKNKSKQPRRKAALIRESTPAEKPLETAISENSPLQPPEKGNHFATSQEDNPFASLLSAPRKVAQSSTFGEHQPAHMLDISGSDVAHPPQRGLTPNLGLDTAITTQQNRSDSPELTHSGPNLSNEKARELPPSSGARRARQQRQPSKKSSRIASPDTEASAINAAPETTKSRPAHQTRTTKNSDDEGSSRPSRRVPRAESDDSNVEERPRAPVAPRLAKLSRKSVRSREIFGFVPSSPPVVNTRISEQSSLVIHGLPPAEDAPGGASCSREPAEKQLPVPNNKNPPEEHPQNDLSLAKPLQAAPATLYRHSSIPNGRTGENKIGQSKMAQGGNSATKRSEDLSERDCFGRHRPSTFPSWYGANSDLNKASSEPVPDAQTIAGPEKEAAPTTAVQCRDKHDPPHTGGPAANRQLHKAPSSPEQPQRQVKHAPDDSRVTQGTTDRQLPDAPPAAGPSRPRIANPATRGRKAALKSDAAGQVPQSILPTEPIPAARMAMRPPAVVRQDSTGNERPRITMKFPGFTSAKEGGPWSREAYDLLERGRPGGVGG